VAEARTIIEAWREDYNTVRPHGSLGQQTPAAYAAASAGPLLVEGACSAALAATEGTTISDGLSSTA
jgi:putative transposase